MTFLNVAEFVRILTQANAVTKFQGHLEVGSGGTLTRFRYKILHRVARKGMRDRSETAAFTLHWRHGACALLGGSGPFQIIPRCRWTRRHVA